MLYNVKLIVSYSTLQYVSVFCSLIVATGCSPRGKRAARSYNQPAASIIGGGNWIINTRDSK
ncbi:MAG: hypothetical protein RR595_09030 [Lysinibacillus sp.]